MVQSFYRRHLQNTTNNVTGAQEDHDRSRYAAYSVLTEYAHNCRNNKIVYNKRRNVNGHNMEVLIKDLKETNWDTCSNTQ